MKRTVGQAFGDEYRTLTEYQVVDTLLLEGHAYEADAPMARAEARNALRRWVASGLDVRESGGEMLFDPIEAVCFAKAAGLRGDDDYWERNLVGTLRRFVTDLDAAPPSRATVQYRRQFDTSRVPAGETLRLRMPAPLAERYPVLDIRPDLPDQATGHRLSNGRIEARVITTDASTITLGARFEFEVGEAAIDAAPDREIYLRPNEGLVVITPRVAALAQHLRGSSPPDAAVRAFWDYLIGNFTFCPIHYDQVPTDAPLDWVLDRQVYDCQLASALLVALCRASGISGRMIGGNFLYPRSPTNHYWAELWLENSGWTPFDFIGWDLSRGGQDAEWRDRFFGRLDARLITECLPRMFTGAIGVPVPQAWFMLRTIEGNGAQLRLTGVDGQTVYRDSIALL